MIPPPPISTLFPYTTLFRSPGFPHHTARSACLKYSNRQSLCYDVKKSQYEKGKYYGTITMGDRKSTRLNSSHVAISYAVFCLKKKTKITTSKRTRRTVERAA